MIEPQESPYVPLGCSCDFMNEMNIGWRGKPRMTPAQYRGALIAALPALLARGVTVYGGVVSDTDTNGVAWMREVFNGMPPEVGACWHRYAAENDPNKPKSGWPSRSAETAAMRAVNGTRPFIISEWSYPTRYVVKFLWGLIKTTRTMFDGDQFNAERQECGYWKAQGATGIMRYRREDAPGEPPFGLKTMDGQWRRALTVPLHA